MQFLDQSTIIPINLGYIQINTWAFPYGPGYHPETPILALDEVEAHIVPGQYGPRYGNDLVVIQ